MKIKTIKDIENSLVSGELKVRYHTGVGFMQAYINSEVRLHVWHPELPGEVEAFGSRHNHRFDLSSTVLLGAVADTSLRVSQELHAYPGQFRLYEVQPAHLDDTSAPVRVGGPVHVEISSVRKLLKGATYYIPRGEFHESRAEGLTVTIVEKYNQIDTPAQILAHRTQVPEHAMLRKPSQVLINQLFFSALRKLGPDALDVVERSLIGAK